MILLAQVGCGTQAQRQVNTGLIARPDVQLVAVVDPNRDSQNYVDWISGATATRSASSWEPEWGADNTGIRAGREVAREITEAYYQKQNRPAAASAPTKTSARCSRRSRTSRASSTSRPIISTEASTSPRCGRTRPRSRTSRSRACSTSCGATCRRRSESRAASHLLAYSNNPHRHTLAAWIKAGAIGTGARSAQLDRTGRSGRRACSDYHASGPAVPDGFNWTLWQGPEPDRPYHPSYTFAVYRGWYAYGTGCLGDMGHYSLWQPYRILDLGVPEFVEARPNNEACVSDRTTSAPAAASRA